MECVSSRNPPTLFFSLVKKKGEKKIEKITKKKEEKKRIEWACVVLAGDPNQYGHRLPVGKSGQVWPKANN